MCCWEKADLNFQSFMYEMILFQFPSLTAQITKQGLSTKVLLLRVSINSEELDHTIISENALLKSIIQNKINCWTKQIQRHGHMEHTDSCQSRGGTGWKRVRGLAKEHTSTCLTHRHRQQCGDSQRGEGGGWGARRRWTMPGLGVGTSVRA